MTDEPKSVLHDIDAEKIHKVLYPEEHQRRFIEQILKERDELKERLAEVTKHLNGEIECLKARIAKHKCDEDSCYCYDL